MEVKKTSPIGIALICRFEGCKLEAYRDVSPQRLVTIGYGHTGIGVCMGQTITQERAEQLLAADLLAFEGEVTRAVKVPLNQNQYDALVAFAYNCKGWQTSTLIRLVNAGQFAQAADEFPKWCHSGAEVEPGLVKRRAAERDLFLSGIGV